MVFNKIELLNTNEDSSFEDVGAYVLAIVMFDGKVLVAALDWIPLDDVDEDSGFEETGEALLVRAKLDDDVPANVIDEYTLADRMVDTDISELRDETPADEVVSVNGAEAPL